MIMVCGADGRTPNEESLVQQLYPGAERCGGGAVTVIASLFESNIFETLEDVLPGTYDKMFKDMIDNKKLVECIRMLMRGVEGNRSIKNTDAWTQLSAMVAALNGSSFFDEHKELRASEHTRTLVRLNS